MKHRELVAKGIPVEAGGPVQGYALDRLPRVYGRRNNTQRVQARVVGSLGVYPHCDTRKSPFSFFWGKEALSVVS